MYDAVIIPAAPTATFQLTSQKPKRCKFARATTDAVEEKGEQRVVQKNSSPGHLLGPTSSSKQSKVHLMQRSSACIAGGVQPHASCLGWCKRDALPLQPGYFLSVFWKLISVCLVSASHLLLQAFAHYSTLWEKKALQGRDLSVQPFVCKACPSIQGIPEASVTPISEHAPSHSGCSWLDGSPAS